MDASFKTFVCSGDVKTKISEEYGLIVARHVHSTFANSPYIQERNARFAINRAIASGRMNVEAKFRDYFSIDGNKNFFKISFKAIMVVNRVIAGLISNWMKRNEKVVVQATDNVSERQKKAAFDELRFVVENRATVEQLSAQSGVPLTQPDAFIPEDADQLDEWAAEFNKIPEEIKYQLGINNIFRGNGLYDVIKEKLLQDATETGLIGVETLMGEDGAIVVKHIEPEKIFYSDSAYDDFRDTSVRGVKRTLKITDLRAMYGEKSKAEKKLTEEEIMRIANTSAQCARAYDYIAEYGYMTHRPYDEFSVDVIEFELRSLDTEDIYVTKTKRNKATIVKFTPPEEKHKAQTTQITKQERNIYRGVYHKATDKLLEWGLKKNMIRPNDPKESGDAEFSYSFYMPQSRGMRNIAIPEKVEEPVEQMILTRLKIQQLVSTMTPPGAAIDLDAMQSLDLGLGDLFSPLDIQKLHHQTGKLYYRGRDTEGNPMPIPIKELTNSGFIGQMQALIALYDYHFRVFKDELGDDPNLLSHAATPRVSQGNIQVSMAAADNATDSSYRAYLYLMKDVSRKVACLLHNSVVYGAKAYREVISKEDISGGGANRVFSTDIQLLPQDNEIQMFAQQLTETIRANPLMGAYIDTFKLMRIAKEDLKLAELYFRNGQKRFIRAEQERAAMNSEMNATSQQESLAMKAQADKALSDADKNTEITKLVVGGSFDLLKSGMALPDDLRQTLQEVVKNVALPISIMNTQIEQELAQQAMNEEMAAAEMAEQQQAQNNLQPN